MNRLPQSRTAAAVAAVVTGIAILYTLGLLVGMPDPTWAYLPRAVLHLGELAAVVALALCGAAGGGPLARIGLGAAGLGLLLLAVAEVVNDSSPGVGETLFGIGPVLVGLGMIAAGVAVVRTRWWGGWHRYVPLVLGIYVVVVMMPLIVVSGGPPAPAALWALTGWDVLWLLVAVSVLTGTAGAAQRDTASARRA